MINDDPYDFGCKGCGGEVNYRGVSMQFPEGDICGSCIQQVLHHGNIIRADDNEDDHQEDISMPRRIP